MRNKAVVKGVRTLFDAGTATGLSDGQLLERYLRRGDDSAEAAFAGPGRAARADGAPRLPGRARDPHAAEDAFQATFLILARRAGSIRKRARSRAGSTAWPVAWRGGRTWPAPGGPRTTGVEMAGRRRPRRMSDEDRRDPGGVDRLPEKYRSAVVLCYLEGLTQDEAAVQLRVPAGTVRVRLMRAGPAPRG